MNIKELAANLRHRQFNASFCGKWISVNKAQDVNELLDFIDGARVIALDGSQCIKCGQVVEQTNVVVGKMEGTLLFIPNRQPSLEELAEKLKGCYDKAPGGVCSFASCGYCDNVRNLVKAALEREE